MDSKEYKQAAIELSQYIAEYLESIRDRPVLPDVEPGYLRSLVPTEPPRTGEPWSEIIADVDRVIMPGVTHWQSPHMHAYFPALTSYPSLLGDMLADAINCIGFTWASSPACTELEALVMDWLAKMIGLPEKFIHSRSRTAGGGIIQTTLSDATFVSILAARNNILAQHVPPTPPSPAVQRQNSGSSSPTPPGPSSDAVVKKRGELSARLVAYCSDQSHSSVEKACVASLIELRILPSEEDFGLSGRVLEKAVTEDIQRGKLPFYVCATLGTTGCCAFDRLEEIAAVCDQYRLWLHVDAAYAGSAFICPEFQYLMKGVSYAQSFAFNPSKWLLVHFDCTAMWVADSRLLHRTFNVDPLYLQHDRAGAAIDYMHWQIPLSRRFRSLKVWFVIRSYGVSGLQKHIREGIERAKQFEKLVSSDSRFEMPAKRHLGLVVFRLKGDNCTTERLLKAINLDRRLHCVPANLKGTYVIRFVVSSTHTTADDIVRDWSIIQEFAGEILNKHASEMKKPPSTARQIAKLLTPGSSKRHSCHEDLPIEGLSLLLSGTPESPKIINCSYAAIKSDSRVEQFFAEMTHNGTEWFQTNGDQPQETKNHAIVNGKLASGSEKRPDQSLKQGASQSAAATPVMARSQLAAAKVASRPRSKEEPADAGSASTASQQPGSSSTPMAKRKHKENANKAENFFSALKTSFKNFGGGLASIGKTSTKGGKQ